MVEACVKSGTAKRIVYTGTVISCSPLKDVANAVYRDSIDESCWTPIDTDLPFADNPLLVHQEDRVNICNVYGKF